MRKKTTKKEKQNKNLLIDENVLIYIYHTEIVIFVKKSVQLLSLKIYTR